MGMARLKKKGINVTLRSVRVTIVAAKKETNISDSECVFVALVIQNSKCMRPTILSSVDCPVLTYFTPVSHKRHDFRKKSYST